MNFLDYSGLQRFLERLKAIIPTKTSDIQNDSGYLTQHNPVDSALSTTSENAVQNKVVKDALDGKSDTGHTHTTSEVSGLSTVATSGSYNDLSNTPTIPVVNNAKLTIQRNGTTVKTFTANASSNVTANITVPTAVSELTNDSGYLTSASSLDSSKLTGTIDIARLPKGALERLVTVANQTARFALTTTDVQLGDTVKQLDTGVMYIVTDETKLSSADGYTEYTAGSATSVPWSGVTGKPSSFTPSSHTHGNVTNDGKLPTASRALISDSSKNITVSSVSDTELGYLSGVTSAIQTQLNGKAASNHVHGNITNDGKVGTTANKPLITGTGGVVQAGSFGNAANTFCEGNDSRLSDARTPVAHTHTTSDVTDLLNSDFIPSANNSYDLGSNSNQWNNLYAKNYYYNGVAWGLDKSNTWTGDNTYTVTINYQSSYTLGNPPQSATAQTAVMVTDSAGTNYLAQITTYQDTTLSGLRFTIRDKFDSNGFSPSGNNRNKHFYFLQGTSNRGYLQWEGFVNNNIHPLETNTYNLGTTAYQWNTICAKNYFYNGTQWGLDQANTWTAQNSFNSDLNLNYASTDVDDIVNSVAGSATLDNFVHMTGNETVNGIKSFPDGVIANVTGSATSATNDGSGNVISTTYGKLGTNNVWTNENTFSATINYKTNHSLGNLPQDNEAQIALKFIDVEGTNYLGQVSSYQNTTSTGFRFTIRDKFDSNGLFSQNGENRNKYLLFLQNEENRGYLQWDGFVNNGLYPLVSNNANLGSIALQWNNICARDYYYNGTKWGLDQSNQWTKNQIISSSTGGNCFIIRTLNSELGEETPETSKMFGSFLFEDKNLANVGGFGITHFSNGEFLGRWLVRYKFTNGTKSTSGTEVPSAVDLGLSSTGESFFRPYYSNTTDLGDSGHKWKTLNGVNPGALSLPSENYSSANLDPTNWNTDGSLINNYTPPSDGWLGILVNSADISDLTGQYIFVGRSDNSNFWPQGITVPLCSDYNSSYLSGCVFMPVVSGKTIGIRIKMGKTQTEGSIITARFYSALGNV